MEDKTENLLKLDLRYIFDCVNISLVGTHENIAVFTADGNLYKVTDWNSDHPQFNKLKNEI